MNSYLNRGVNEKVFWERFIFPMLRRTYFSTNARHHYKLAMQLLLYKHGLQVSILESIQSQHYQKL